jgi:hypothetical protein
MTEWVGSRWLGTGYVGGRVGCGDLAVASMKGRRRCDSDSQ